MISNKYLSEYGYMNKNIGLLFLFALLISCATGEISFKKDDFKGTTVAKMELNHYTGRSILCAEYLREFKDSEALPANVNCKFRTNADATMLKSEAFLKIGDKISNVNFTNITGEIQNRIDKAKIADASEDDGFKEKTTIHSCKIFSCTLVLTPDIESQILKTDQVSLRVYFGSQDVTFIIKDDDLIKIKKFLTAKPAA